jgi:hypothetical protein
MVENIPWGTTRFKSLEEESYKSPAFIVCYDFRSLTSDYSFIVNSHSSIGFVLGCDWHTYCAEVAKEQDVNMPLPELHAPSEWLYFFCCFVCSRCLFLS